MKHLLVMRLSAFGDVAMSVPVVREFLEQNPEVHITFVSHFALAPLFESLERVEFFPAYLREQHKGLKGLCRLYRQVMRQGPYDAVLDLHSVIRTHFLRMLFHLQRIPVYKIHKDRRARKALTRREDKVKRMMRPMPERYADVFRQAGFSLNLSNRLRKTLRPLSAHTLKVLALPEASQTKPWIGIAPFARYTGKTYPPQKMFAAVKKIAAQGNCLLLLFGAKGHEQTELERWKELLPDARVVAGKLSLSEELDVISHLKVMVSMDSANMHLASLVGTRAVSVWGATHPFAGFLGYGQTPCDVVEVEMDCRPCSIFGSKPCFKSTYECMHAIATVTLARTVELAADL